MSHRTSRKSRISRRPRTRRLLAGAIGLVAVLVAATAGLAQGKAHAASVATIKIAIVSNSNMLNIEKLTPAFEKMNPGIKVVYDTLNENNERALIETDITTHANEFNAVMISNYETPIWAKNGWLVNLSPQLTADKSYDVGDLLKPIANALTYNGGLYSVPFYGESSMVYYRKDLFKAAGLTMPLHPTWAADRVLRAEAQRPGQGHRGHLPAWPVRLGREPGGRSTR